MLQLAATHTFPAKDSYLPLADASPDITKILTAKAIKELDRVSKISYHFFHLQKMIEDNLGCSAFEAQQYIKTAQHRLDRRVESMSTILDRLAFSREGFAMLARLRARDHLLALQAL